ncbi:hypothetical protein [Paractinoplanes atraurantiacus]|uniref:SipW-cognate class signal peptide n=1 Tax=Paractinoplanes atraurantiacus TaxID=1036182 RepID=A0A285IWU5_9ACTN|nr:hypothetical protein [Actinoplanes atraurantiacus]SNY52147.1 hypothetical protein SAMN05421748_112267 [Actinoplanes atraurantiacus]
MRKSIKRAVIAGVAVVAVGGAATAAYAAWNANGSGVAGANATTAQELKVSAAKVTSGLLYPTGTGDAAVTIENPNKYPVTVTDIKWNDKDGVQADKKDCNNTGVYFGDFSKNDIGSNGLLSKLNLRLAGGETKTFTLADAVHMTNNSQNECQGAAFTIKVAVSGASADK